MARAGVGARAGGAARKREGVSSSRGRGVVVGSPRVRVSEMQRARLLGAAVAMVDELGYARATVALITARARVSRRTFYDLFSDREDCLLAVLDDVVELVSAEIVLAGVGGLSWRERVRGGLWVVLCLFDREPALARVCVVQALRGGPVVLERRAEVLARLAGVVDGGRGERARGASECPLLTGEGLVGAAVSIVYARLLRGEREPLSGLLGELMSMIVLPYLGPAVARQERSRPVPVSVMSSSGSVASDGTSPVDPLRDIPMRLTYRTARVLEDVAEHPGVSNRMVAEHAGIADQGQASKLLGRLERLGLLANTGEEHAKGERNVWSLTPTGQQVTQSIRARVRYPGAAS